jgi:undecaprenyl diphosphate synthase
MAAAAPSAEAAPGPRHVAIIMDGNGRWARARARPRSFGHREGVEALRRAVEAAGDLSIPYLTVFGFSTENWRRPPDEVNALLDLLRLYVDRDLDRLASEGVRIRVIGARDNLNPDILDMIERAERRTAHNAALNLTIAFNYGGRQEITRAARKLAQDVAAGRVAVDTITPDLFATYLDTHDLPAPDIVIRTSGELRLSNFLLWQAAYSELVFLDVLWPDFDRAALERAIAEFARRDRRYGGVGGESAS